MYDENGQMLSPTLMEYLVPSVLDVAAIEVHHRQTPVPFTIGGIKGMGEGGAIAPLPASEIGPRTSRYHRSRGGAPVAQLIVRNLEDSVKEKLRRRAARRRRSLEAEIRDILRDAVARPEANERHLGSRIASRFAGRGLNLHFPELRGQPARAARFNT